MAYGKWLGCVITTEQALSSWDQKTSVFYEAEFIKIITARGPPQKPRAKIIIPIFFPMPMGSQQVGRSTLPTSCLVLRVGLALRIHYRWTYLVLSFP